MHKMNELKKMLCEELDEITRKGELSVSGLDAIDKLTHSIKSIDTILAMEGYSEDGSYARGRRDSMGRYSNEDGSYSRRGGSYRSGSYDRGSYERGYSRENAKEELATELKRLRTTSSDPEVGHMIDMWMDQLDRQA